MGDVVLHISMSLDGFIAGPNVDVEQAMGEGGERLHDWLLGACDTSDKEVAAEMFAPATTGAVVMGRRTFDVGVGQWGEDGTFGLPCFVVTHRPTEPVVRATTTFSFVTDGLESALRQAQRVAGDKRVNVMGAELAQQLLGAGLLDQMQLNLIPVLLGDGTRLFEHIGPDQIELQRTGLIASCGVTHLTYRVLTRPYRSRSSTGCLLDLAR